MSRWCLPLLLTLTCTRSLRSLGERGGVSGFGGGAGPGWPPFTPKTSFIPSSFPLKVRLDLFRALLRLVEIVVLVVLRTLQCRLQCKTILGDLVHPNIW